MNPKIEELLGFFTTKDLHYPECLQRPYRINADYIGAATGAIALSLKDDTAILDDLTDTKVAPVIREIFTMWGKGEYIFLSKQEIEDVVFSEEDALHNTQASNILRSIATVFLAEIHKAMQILEVDAVRVWNDKNKFVVLFPEYDIRLSMYGRFDPNNPPI